MSFISGGPDGHSLGRHWPGFEAEAESDADIEAAAAAAAAMLTFAAANAVSIDVITAAINLGSIDGGDGQLNVKSRRLGDGHKRPADVVESPPSQSTAAAWKKQWIKIHADADKEAQSLTAEQVRIADAYIKTLRIEFRVTRTPRRPGRDRDVCGWVFDHITGQPCDDGIAGKFKELVKVIQDADTASHSKSAPESLARTIYRHIRTLAAFIRRGVYIAVRFETHLPTAVAGAITIMGTTFRHCTVQQRTFTFRHVLE